MAAQRYEISLRVLTHIFMSERSELVKYFSAGKEKFRISKRPCNILFIIIINTSEILNHFTKGIKRCDFCM